MPDAGQASARVSGPGDFPCKVRHKSEVGACMSNLRKMVGLVALVFALIAVFYDALVVQLGEQWVWLIICAVALIGGRLILYLYRMAKGRKDGLTTSKWWDVFF
ncbi:hypothetical protein SFA35_26305 (plasmid) [Pseudomonas sp. HR96]|uniref:hypothetical protein n=1 Tax=Pseudomonas sp. HR96 TaxID=1027966 RepID=UPI002A75C492|nr:hypothetical protein [Pseudomonas sp. HR96]WPP02615.1 hypothetical protein SFA35_26305 [Pseudomonas sp. HR96]